MEIFLFNIFFIGSYTGISNNYTIMWYYYYCTVFHILTIFIALFVMMKHWKNLSRPRGDLNPRRWSQSTFERVVETVLPNSGLHASFFGDGLEQRMSVDWHQRRGFKSLHDQEKFLKLYEKIWNSCVAC